MQTETTTSAPKVRNMRSSKGNKVPNQFEIREGNKRVFQSYDSIVVVVERTAEGERVTLDTDWEYSRTTSKYRNAFLGESTKETRAKVKSGEYQVKDLNKRG